MGNGGSSGNSAKNSQKVFPRDAPGYAGHLKICLLGHPQITGVHEARETQSTCIKTHSTVSLPTQFCSKAIV